MRTNHHRRHIVKKRTIPPASLNSIQVHEQSIASIIESTADRYKTFNARCLAYQKHQKTKSKLSQKQRWINQRYKLDLEEVKLSKEIDDVYANCPDLKKVKDVDDEAFDQLISWKDVNAYLASICKSCKENKANCNDTTKKQLEVQNDKLEVKYEQIGQELEKIRKQMKSVSNNESKENTTAPLPQHIVNAIEDVRSEFYQLGIEGESEIGHELDMKLKEVTSNLSVELSKFHVRNENTIQHQNQSAGEIWDEKDRIILRNAMEEYKNINMSEKRTMLKSMSKQMKKSPQDIKNELQKMQCERHIRTRKKDERRMSSKSRAQIIETASEKIKEIRVLFVERLTGDLHCLVQDEISKEREQRIDILTNMKACIEARQREEKTRLEILEKEEIDRLSLKRQQDVAEVKDKLSKHMELKEEEKRILEAEEWIRRNEENEARMIRLDKNGER